MASKPIGSRPLLWRILIYLTSALALLAAYFGLLLLLGFIIPKFEQQAIIAAVLLILLAIFFLEPFQKLLQSGLEMGGMPVKRKALAPLEAMLVKLGQANNLDSLAVELTNLLRQDLNLTFAAFAVYSEVKRTEGEVRNFDFIKFGGDNHYEPLSRRLVFRPIKSFNTAELVSSEVNPAERGLIMKIRIGAEQRGLMCIGQHLDSSEFKPSDYSTLEALAGPVAVMVNSTLKVRELEKNIGTLEKKVAEQQDEFNKLRQSREELQLLNQKTVQDTEEERIGLARELQGGPISNVGQIVSQLEHQSYNLSEREEVIWHLALESQKQLDGIVTRLRPSSLDKLGLVAAINRMVEDTRHRVRLALKFNVGPELEVRRLPSDIELSLYRVAEEAMQNVIQHAKAQHVTISLAMNEETEVVRLAVLDDGAGFTPPAQFAANDKTGTLGLAGLQERLTSLGGKLKVRSSPGAGAVIEAEVPLKRG